MKENFNKSNTMYQQRTSQKEQQKYITKTKSIPNR